MPEGIEYEKLRRQLTPAWTGNQIVRLTAPPWSPTPRKYVQGEWTPFIEALKNNTIEGIHRHGKMLFIRLQSHHTWQIHLSSTGWLMPGNEAAKAKANIDPIHRNFLHGINDDNIRLRIHLADGQTWDYHDSRTWGKWWLREPGWEPTKPGFDWLLQPRQAAAALTAHQSRRPAKDVLCDQHVTAGLGNYTSCEILWRARIHPHTRWHLLTEQTRTNLTDEIRQFLSQCLERNDHSHWGVFAKHGEPCPRHPDQPIAYAKDGKNGKRGSYFCTKCQEKREAV